MYAKRVVPAAADAVAVGRRRGRRRQRHLGEARQHGRHLHDRDHGLAPPGLVLFAVHEHRQVEAAVAQHRERVAGIDRQRRQHRPHLAREERGQVRLLLGRQITGRDAADAQVGEARLDVGAPAPVQIVHHRVGAGADGRELLGRGQAVGRGLDDVAGQLLLETGDADHEELVQIRRDDGDELEAFAERHRRIARFLEHAFVEAEPGQLPVDEQLRGRRVRDRGRLTDDWLALAPCHGRGV